jgi:amino acid adenylation domain-containing protein
LHHQLTGATIAQPTEHPRLRDTDIRRLEMVVSAVHARSPEERSRQYWRGLLGDFGGAARLGRNGPRKRRGPVHRIEFALRYEPDGMLGTQDELGLYAAVLAALDICLYRYTGVRRQTIASPRPVGSAAVLDAFPIVTEVRTGQSFQELHAWIRDQLTAAYTHGDYPLERLIEDLGLPVAEGTCPLFDATCRLVGTHELAPGWPVGLAVTVTGDDLGIRGVVEIDGDLLGEQEARWFRDHLVHVLQSADRSPGLALFELGVLPADVARKVLHEWNDSRSGAERDECLHHLFEAQVARRGNAVAVSGATGSLSYAELDRAANRLANHLVYDLHVRRGDLVGIATNRCLEMVVAVLAVLKAGATYVPLDPADPADRLRFILQDTGVTLVLTLDRHVAAVPAGLATIVCLDSEAGRIAGLSDQAPPVRGLPAAVACVIYTSGSTGRPKGVLLPHRALCNSLRWEAATYQLDDRDRLLHMASFGFSLAIVEVFAPLAVGAQVVLAPPDATRDSAWIARLVAEHGITVLSVVPAELKLLLEQEPGMPWTMLRRVITGADVLPVPVQERYFATCPSVPLINVYGQTESAVDGTYWICRPVSGQSTVPIGRPIANTRVYVLDQDMQPVPVGVPGELYMGGICLAHGYLGRPGLTADRFVPNPFTDATHTRLYRSGDVARWLPDGALELLGRNDLQIQIRGIRVELEEIEAVLREHPAVGNAAVASHQRAHTSAEPSREQWASLLTSVSEETVKRQLAEAERP